MENGLLMGHLDLTPILDAYTLSFEHVHTNFTFPDDKFAVHLQL